MLGRFGLAIFLIIYLSHDAIAAIAFHGPLPHKLDSSPLDTDAFIGGVPKRSPNSLADSIATLPSCQLKCATALLGALRLFFRSGNHIERFNNICGKYTEARNCINEQSHCDSPMFFDVLTSGLKYMCVDQYAAFNATIECIDAQATAVQNECEKQCNTQGVLMNLILQSGITNLLFSGDGGANLVGAVPAPLGQPVAPNMPPQLNAALLRQTIRDGCRVSQCLLECIKTKFNARCQGSAGTLLAEVFVRPMAEGQQMMSVIPLSNMLANIVPNECSFMISPQEMRKFRIDRELEQELHRMYDMQGRQPASVGLQPISPLDQLAQPFNEANLMDSGLPSPLELDSFVAGKPAPFAESAGDSEAGAAPLRATGQASRKPTHITVHQLRGAPGRQAVRVNRRLTTRRRLSGKKRMQQRIAAKKQRKRT